MSLKIPNKSVFLVASSQFGIVFSHNFVMSFMPFYLLNISTFGPEETMVWTGMIMGISHFITASAAPFWGRLTSRFSPRLLYERGFLAGAIITLSLGFTHNFYLLFLLRLIQGTLGGVSTIGLILISALSPKERIHKDVGLFQNFITAGQLLGPPLGTYAASLLGYRGAFVFASALLFVFLVFCHWNITDIPLQRKEMGQQATSKKSIIWSWVLALSATIQLSFLPSILPKVLEGFQRTGTGALNLAGTIIMLYTATAILGTYIFSRLSTTKGTKPVIIVTCLAAALLQLVLYLSKGLLSFVAIRMIQTGFIAAVFPLMISLFAQGVGGGTLGFLNSARFLGTGIGPLMATSVLAYSNLLTLYLLIAGLTFTALWGFLTSAKPQET